MPRFKKIYIEITNTCNMKCSFCVGTKREPCQMSVFDFQRVIEKIKPYTKFIYMHVMGEPLTHTSIGELLDICEMNEIQANITTNGTLLKERGREILSKRALRQINISLHSFEGKNVEYFEKYLKDVFSFAKAASRAEKTICLRLWNLKSGADSYGHAIGLIKKEFGLSAGILAETTDRNGIKLSENIYLQQEERFIWPEVNGKEIFTKGRCYALKTHVGILSDGTVIPCCIDSEGSLALGNIFENGFESIITSAKAENILKGFRERRVEEKFCRTCGFRHNV